MVLNVCQVVNFFSDVDGNHDTKFEECTCLAWWGDGERARGYPTKVESYFFHIYIKDRSQLM